MSELTITAILKKRSLALHYFIFLTKDIPIFFWSLILRKFVRRFLVTYAYKKTGLLLPFETWAEIGMKYLEARTKVIR